MEGRYKKRAIMSGEEHGVSQGSFPTMARKGKVLQEIGECFKTRALCEWGKQGCFRKKVSHPIVWRVLKFGIPAFLARMMPSRMPCFLCNLFVKSTGP